MPETVESLVAEMKSDTVSNGNYESVGVTIAERLIRRAASLNADKLEKAREAIAGLLWPNVISADDLAILVAMSAGTGERHQEAMTCVDKLRAAQEAGQATLSLIKEEA